MSRLTLALLAATAGHLQVVVSDVFPLDRAVAGLGRLTFGGQARSSSSRSMPELRPA